MNHIPAGDIRAVLYPPLPASDIIFRLQPFTGRYSGYAGQRANFPSVVVTAYGTGFDERGAQKYVLEVKVDGRVLFPATGPVVLLWGAFSPGWACDCAEAKHHALHHLALAPGDTDAEAFAQYSPAQLAFVQRYGDALKLIAEDRYGDD